MRTMIDQAVAEILLQRVAKSFFLLGGCIANSATKPQLQTTRIDVLIIEDGAIFCLLDETGIGQSLTERASIGVGAVLLLRRRGMGAAFGGTGSGRTAAYCDCAGRDLESLSDRAETGETVTSSLLPQQGQSTCICFSSVVS